MTQLSQEGFAAARHYLLIEARPLEAAIFRHEFEGGSDGDVLTELAAFQNGDGGFGCAMEPDFRLPDSSPLATSLALQRLSALPPSAQRTKMTKAAMGYLIERYDPSREGWAAVPAEIVDHPRAPWWDPDEEEGAARSWPNPTAELTGYLYEFPSAAGDRLRQALTERALAWLDGLADPIEMHDLLCFLRLAVRLPGPMQAELYRRLDPLVPKAVAVDPTAWAGYCLQPVQVAPSPRSRYYKSLRPAVEANLDHLIGRQGQDGAWEPTWAWGRYEEVWQTARREWRGILTLENLRLVYAHGRLATPAPPRHYAS